jgi:hypothetical protein
MTIATSPESREKIALIWAERRERLIAVRVQFRVTNEDGCTVYSLESMQEMG